MKTTMRRFFISLLLVVCAALPVAAEVGEAFLVAANSDGEASFTLSKNWNEKLSYTLYFNWKFVWIKAGKASLTTRSTTYKGLPAVESTLLAQSAGAAESIYHLSDTLRTVVSTELDPLYFVKHCEEGDDIVYERAWFSRTAEGRYRADISKVYTDGHERKADYVGDKPVYDMISVMLHARSLDFRSLTKGRRLVYPVAGGKRVEMQTLVYLGREKIKKQSGDTADTHVFSLVTPKTKDGITTEQEVLRFYITTDDSHIPLQIDLFLKFGCAKAKLD